MKEGTRQRGRGGEINFFIEIHVAMEALIPIDAHFTAYNKAVGAAIMPIDLEAADILGCYFASLKRKKYSSVLPPSSTKKNHSWHQLPIESTFVSMEIRENKRNPTMDLLLPPEHTDKERKLVDFENAWPRKTSVAFQKNGYKTGKKCKAERPRSGSLFGSSGFSDGEVKARARSWEALHGEISDRFWSEERNKRENVGRKLPGRKECYCCRERSPRLPSRCSSGCSFRIFEEGSRELWSPCKFHIQKKCKSNSDISKPIYHNWERTPDGEKDFQKVKRSLRLLGFELADFGVSSGGTDMGDRCKRKQRTPTISTRITDRSISLDSLRAAVKQAWLDDRLDESHRRLLSQAAYEEWYFTKERELWQKREEEKAARQRAKQSLRDDFLRKKQKSEEEFQKWLLTKKQKRKEHDAKLLQKETDPLSRLKKTKEESEKAFIKWKKSKDKALEREKKKRKTEEEKKAETERQKTERKIIAEKAFQQWKSKLEENEKSKEAKRKRRARQHDLEEKRKLEGTKIPFHVWKNAKDEEKKEKIKKFREADRLAREERLAQMEERMYEAEQAFEDWLEKVDLRRQKQFYSLNNCQKNIPWIPI